MARRIRVVTFVGTRPEVIKMYSPIQALRDLDSDFETIVCSSGQHAELLSDALTTFGMSADYQLAVMRKNQRPAEVAWKVAQWAAEICDRLRPDVVMVQGDTTTTMAAGIAAFHSSTRVAHVEAGLRTYDNSAPWPEEGHRRIVGAIADLHFAPSESAAANLVREGVAADRVFLTGNTGIDALYWARSQPRRTAAPAEGQRRIVITTHRRESIPDGIRSIFGAVRQLAGLYPDVQFQLVRHPSPPVIRMIQQTLNGCRPRNVEVLAPCSYIPFTHMLADSYLIVTDSGGIQEEAPALGKPLLVVNRRTEREEPLRAGTSNLVGTDQNDIVEAVAALLEDPVHYARMATRHDPYGDGLAGERIVKILGEVIAPSVGTELRR
ncbi:UDP-N-acetylglucosamine 2-epimerase (non-hydrolyzing) [Streptomyces sp. NPDC000070]|uniref:non-hydrolyzing UDP-N-acetylglucosamine 2-epimerase n=1 Tax=Streptomyces sp. NPDC000070 TaxID=3154240 RepID=UPI00331D6804